MGCLRNLVVGDVVLIKEDEPAPRTQWRIGKVIQLVMGRDGQVRGAKLKVLAKSGKQSKQLYMTNTETYCIRDR